jgi:hypothetical protein
LAVTVVPAVVDSVTPPLLLACVPFGWTDAAVVVDIGAKVVKVGVEEVERGGRALEAVVAMALTGRGGV